MLTNNDEVLSTAPDGGRDINAALIIYPEQLTQLSLLNKDDAQACLEALAAWIVDGNYGEPTTSTAAKRVFSAIREKHIENVATYRKRKADATTAIKKRWNNKKKDTTVIRSYNGGITTELPRNYQSNTTTNHYPLSLSSTVVEEENTAAPTPPKKRIFPTLDEVKLVAHNIGAKDPKFVDTFFKDMTKDGWVFFRGGETVHVNSDNLSKTMNGRWKHWKEEAANQEKPNLEAMRKKIKAEKLNADNGGGEA